MGIFHNYQDPIEDIERYVKNEYHETVINERTRCFNIDQRVNKEFYSKNNCSLVAMSKAIYYLGKFDDSNYLHDIYDIVYEKAHIKGYFEKIGTYPIFIPRIVRRSFSRLKISNIKVHNRYLLSFNSIVKQIENGTPVIINLFTGYYKWHTVVCNGYTIVETENGNRIFLNVIDGWKNKERFIDFSRVNRLLILFQIFKLNNN